MGNPFEHERRKPLTALQRAKLFAERGGICGGCKQRIKAGDPWIDEHVIALALGGTNDWSNRELRCGDCAKEKTKEDLKRVAKAKRVYAKHVGAKKSKRPMQGSKASGLRKRMDGTVERRK